MLVLEGDLGWGGLSSAPAPLAFLKVHISTPIAGKTNTEEETLSRQSRCWPATHTLSYCLSKGGGGRSKNRGGTV